MHAVKCDFTPRLYIAARNASMHTHGTTARNERHLPHTGVLDCDSKIAARGIDDPAVDVRGRQTVVERSPRRSSIRGAKDAADWGQNENIPIGARIDDQLRLHIGFRRMAKPRPGDAK